MQNPQILCSVTTSNKSFRKKSTLQLLPSFVFRLCQCNGFPKMFLCFFFRPSQYFLHVSLSSAQKDRRIEKMPQQVQGLFCYHCGGDATFLLALQGSSHQIRLSQTQLVTHRSIFSPRMPYSNYKDIVNRKAINHKLLVLSETPILEKGQNRFCYM